ncbi:Flp pilus assembly protein CpaB [Acidithiobacillus sp. M4-SHS-6]|uniref:Flp pilus assembly protein CpaB n=1 Tax=Acidithiobacillus sp. M4-SHS-6 TaxID=3383024 RepID=UPI0039BEC0CE
MATQIPSGFEPGSIQKKPARTLRAWLVLAIAVLAGLGAAYLAVVTLKSREHAALERILSQQEKGTVQAVVPIHDIPAGSILDLSMVAARSIPADTAPADIISPDDFDRFSGHRVNVPLLQGRPLLQSYLSGRRTLADLVDPHKLAMTFTVDNLSTMDGMLQPGDHVDVLWFFTGGKDFGASASRQPTLPMAESMPVSAAEGGGMASALAFGSRTGPLIFRTGPSKVEDKLPKETVRYIEHDLKIIATGPHTVAEDSAANINNDPAQTGTANQFQTVTVELSPTQIEKLELAKRLGELTLVLRGHGSQVSVPAKTYTVRDILGIRNKHPGDRLYAADAIEYIIGQTGGGLRSRTELQNLRRLSERAAASDSLANSGSPMAPMGLSSVMPIPLDPLLPPVNQSRS